MPPNAEAAFTTDAARVMTICNACRYCEGFCAVFPAIERHTVFEPADLRYLANLCHNCGECYYACPYTPPHEFAVNVPKLLAEVRAESYRAYAWPHWYGGAIAIWLTAACVLGFVLGAGGGTGQGAGFYGVIPHSAMVAIFGAAGGFVAAMLGLGAARFVREARERAVAAQSPLAPALGDAMRLRYLADRRRWFHHLTFYGFLLAFASTVSAAIDHYAVGLKAPYPFASVPVILGTLGGIGLLIGPAGLYFLKRHRDPAIADPRQDGADVSFLAMLFLTSLTGLLLLALRDTPAMSVLLRVHLGVVLALFLTLPYGKFVHGLYRFAALALYAGETKRGRQTH